MATAASLAAKQLRWQLLELFPQTPMKLLMEAAKSGDFDTAMDIIRASAPSESLPPCLLTQPKESASDESLLAVGSTASDLQELSVCEPASSQFQTVLPEETSTSAQAVVEAGCPLDSSEPIGDAEKHTYADEELNDLRGTAAQAHVPSKVRRTADGWEIKFEVDLERPCQSLRTKRLPSKGVVETVLNCCGSDNTAAYASVCFEQMMRQEQELNGEFCVFYHSYNSAALIYEVQAEIARSAFGLDDKFSPLPRIMQRHFTGVSIQDLQNSEGAKHADSLPSFRKLAICASPTIFAFGSEAPPLHCFRHGYGIPAPLHQLTRDLLCEVTGVSKHKGRAGDVDKCMEQLSHLAKQFGLVAYDGLGEAANAPNRLGGQMLQIFIHRTEVDHMVYNSLPYGVPIPTDSVRKWLAGKDPGHDVDGQVRILMRPEVFMDRARGRIFHYAGDWEFHGGSPDMEGSRAAFVQELRRILRPLLQKVNLADLRLCLTGETDSQRKKRCEIEAADMQHELRSASHRGSAGSAKTSTGGGYIASACPKKGAKHSEKGTTH